MAGNSIDIGAIVSDHADLFNNSQGTVSAATNAAQSSALNEGIYDVWADVDCYIKVHTTANDVTAATGYKLFANNTVPIRVRQDHKIGAILSSTAGTLSYHKVR